MKKLVKFQDLGWDAQKVFLNIKSVFPQQKKREQFEKRLSKFLESDPVHQEIFERRNDTLIYRTECIIPKKQDTRLPVLLLFGNPASHSIYSGMFFSYEHDSREHRFWKSLNKAGFLSFKSNSIISSISLKERNRLRKRELYNLSYNSPFRIGLATFYSTPSSASGYPWSGVAGLHKLFGSEALHKIEEYEKVRVEKLIHQFLSPRGVVIAFQKDAYLKIKSPTSPNYSIALAKKGELNGYCECDPEVRLFCTPPTRLMQGEGSLSLIHSFKKQILK